MTSAFGRAAAILAGATITLGLAVLGWGGFATFTAHPARIALVLLTVVLAVAAFFAGGNLSAGEREARANRWVLVAFAGIGLAMAFLPAYTDRAGGWASSCSPSAVRCGCGRWSCSATVSAAWSPFSRATR